jgi:flagellar motor switch protein FliN/FliY
LDSAAGSAGQDWKSADKPLDDADRAMMAAMEEARRSSFDPSDGGESADDLGGADLDLPEFSSESAGGDGQPISLLHDVQLHVKVELGRTYMFVEDVLRLGEGSVVELDKLAGDPVDVYVNDRLVARGEVLVLNDNFCVRVSEITNGSEAKLAG